MTVASSGTKSPVDDPDNHRRLAGRLDAGVDRLGITLESVATERLLAFLNLLQRWNRAYNLTAVRDPDQMVIRLLLDSLSVVPYIKGLHVLDVGSGPGLPGIPLAIAMPSITVVLLDSNGKKIRFQQQAVGELGLANVSIEQRRVEQYRPETLFDSVVFRAFGSLAAIAAAGARLCRPGGEMLAMKGRYPDAELARIPPGCRLLGVEPLRVPGLDAERYLVRLAAADAADPVG